MRKLRVPLTAGTKRALHEPCWRPRKPGRQCRCRVCGQGAYPREDDVEVAAHERLVRARDVCALEVELGVQAVEQEVAAVEGDAVDKGGNSGDDLAALLEPDYTGWGQLC